MGFDGHQFWLGGKAVSMEDYFSSGLLSPAPGKSLPLRSLTRQEVISIDDQKDVIFVDDHKMNCPKVTFNDPIKKGTSIDKQKSVNTQMKVTSSDVKNDTSDAAKKKDTSDDAKKDDTSDAAKKKDASDDAKKKDTSDAAKKKDTSDDAKKKDASDAAKKKDTSDDAKKKDTSKDIQKKDTSVKLPATLLVEGDVIGCCVDLEKETVRYTKNGKSVKGHLKLFKDCCELLTPAVSFSTGTR